MTLLAVIFFAGLISAAQLGISPAKIDLTAIEGEKVCQIIILDSSVADRLTLRDSWNTKKADDVKSYVFDSENFNLRVDLNETIFVGASEKNELSVCFTGRKTGTYYGAILAESFDKSVSVGSWVELHIQKESPINKLVLTGKSINQTENPELHEIFLGFSLLITLVMVLVLTFLVKKLNKK